MASALASKTFPGFSNTYWLHEFGGSRAFRGRISVSVENAFAVTRAEKPAAQVQVRWSMGSKQPSDIIRTTIAAPVLASDRVVRILKAGEFSGWQTYPIELFGSDGAPVSGYCGLAVPGRCGPIDRSLSNKIDKIYPGGMFPVWKGLYFDPATWDGSDIFMPLGNAGWIFVVEAVRRAFDKAKVKNALFTPLADVELESLNV